MNNMLKNSLRFIAFVLIQSQIFNQLEMGLGIQPMVYPLFILLLPFDTRIGILLLTAFSLGICIDALSNTYGLHASALLVMAYFRPAILKFFAPRDGYDVNKEGNVFVMGNRWFIYVFGILLLIHHLWYFTIEMFTLNQIFFILQKTILSVPISFLLCLLLQVIFIAKPKER
jgi:hypothetical protein